MICRILAVVSLAMILVAGCAWQGAQSRVQDLSEPAPASPPHSPESTGLSIPDLFKNVSQSAVVIQTVEKKLTGKIKDGKAEQESVYGLGSGVLISADGKVMTAAHVVHTADVVAVKFQNGEQIPARVIGSSPAADVSLLQLEKIPEGYAPAKLGDSDLARTGERIMVIGAPHGISKTMTVGYISGRITPDNKLFGLQDMEVFQSDAAVNTGNSGGPMFNMQGEVIGIVSSILTRSGGFEGISFAVTTKTAKKLLLDQPSYWMGIDAVILSGTMAKILNVPEASGVLIQRVAEGSLGDRLGLQSGFMQVKIAKQDIIVGGDIVLKILGQSLPDSPEELISSLDDIRNKVQTMKPGDIVTVTVLRSGEILELKTALK